MKKSKKINSEKKVILDLIRLNWLVVVGIKIVLKKLGHICSYRKILPRQLFIKEKRLRCVVIKVHHYCQINHIFGHKPLIETFLSLQPVILRIPTPSPAPKVILMLNKLLNLLTRLVQMLSRIFSLHYLTVSKM